MMRSADRPRAAGLILILLGGCGGESLGLDGEGTPDSGADTDTDADIGWAPWPPRPGHAGLRLTWSVEGEPPAADSCAAADLDLVRLDLVHPLAGFETWTDAGLEGPCPAAEVGLDPAEGLAPGRYRFRVTLLHGDGAPFQHSPAGVVDLVDGETAHAAHVDVAAAVPGRGVVSARMIPAGQGGVRR